MKLLDLHFRKIDPEIKRFISIEKVKLLPAIITFKKPLEANTESLLKRKGFKIKYHLPFINGVTGKTAVSSFDSISSLPGIRKIYFDGSASLMGKANIYDKKPRPAASPFQTGGRGIAAAFIDSGVYPHPDLIKPRNRIIGFRDFINEINEPYDDNGHGTACIGAAFGASADGKFKSIAYDCDIVCAKAFNALGIGLFSDILAAMQWIYGIKEKHNIRVIVLPFGTCSISRHFDVLCTATESLWKNGLFVCTCSGNLGPNEASMTSPGICSSSFTAGACAAPDSSSKVAGFSGRGPVGSKPEKPDAVMPGCGITSLNSNTSFIPAGQYSYHRNAPDLLYAKTSGTSVAASMAAAAAILLCQKKPGLRPEDIKGVLKKLCVSINELKTAQGAGMIDIKKIEELE